jgi:hypothetical protein
MSAWWILAGPLKADEILYNFAYTEDAGPIQSATFQFDEPDFLTLGIYTIPSFSLTNGTTTWTFTQLGVDPLSNGTCLAFGTSNAVLSNTPTSCGGFWGNPLGGVMISIVPDTALLSTGSYSPSSPFFGLSDNLGQQALASYEGGLTLDISTVPEPSTASAFAAVLLFIAFALHLRHATRPAAGLKRSLGSPRAAKIISS